MSKCVFKYFLMLFAFCAFSGCSEYNSLIPEINLKEDASVIRGDLCKLTPIGMSYDQVVKILSKYQVNVNGKNINNKDAGKYQPIYDIGHYHDSFAWTTTTVNAVWIFDDNDNLTDIKVTKSLSGL